MQEAPPWKVLARQIRRRAPFPFLVCGSQAGEAYSASDLQFHELFGLHQFEQFEPFLTRRIGQSLIKRNKLRRRRTPFRGCKCCCQADLAELFNHLLFRNDRDRR